MSCLQDVMTMSCLVIRRCDLLKTSWRRLKDVCVRWLLWNHTAVCKPCTLFGYRVFGVSFALGVGKGLRQNKCRLVKMSYLSCGKISKLRKYWGNSKIRKNKKIQEHLFLQISTLSKKISGLYQRRERLAPYPSHVKIKDYTRTFIIWKSWNFKID